MSTEELSDTIAALNAKIDAQIAHAQDLAAESAKLEEEVAETTATVSSADGRVTVTARPTGGIESVQLSSNSTATDPAALGALITATIAKAQRAAAEQVLASMSLTLGESSPLVEAVRNDIDTAFPQAGGSTIEYR